MRCPLLCANDVVCGHSSVICARRDFERKGSVSELGPWSSVEVNVSNVSSVYISGRVAQALYAGNSALHYITNVSRSALSAHNVQQHENWRDGGLLPWRLYQWWGCNCENTNLGLPMHFQNWDWGGLNRPITYSQEERIAVGLYAIHGATKWVIFTPGENSKFNFAVLLPASRPNCMGVLTAFPGYRSCVNGNGPEGSKWKSGIKLGETERVKREETDEDKKEMEQGLLPQLTWGFDRCPWCLLVADALCLHS